MYVCMYAWCFELFFHQIFKYYIFKVKLCKSFFFWNKFKIIFEKYYTYKVKLSKSYIAFLEQKVQDF